VREVSHASAAASVLVHMFNPRLQVSEKLQLAAAFAGTKFVSMVLNNCAPD